MQRNSKVTQLRTKATALGLVVGLFGTVFLAGTASADYGPGGYLTSSGKGDIVGVGSDTVQYIGDFLADGDALGHAGYNAAGGKYKFLSFDATTDANGRAAYLNGSTTTSPKPLNPTIVLRAGSAPVQRPNGSSAGINALLADTAGQTINFARSSRPPTAAEQSTAAAKGWTCLHVVQAATDPLKFAVANTTNAPAGISIQQMVTILQDATGTIAWTAVGGSSSNKIIPVIPQAGSGTRSSFLADLKAANGGVDVTLANPNIVTAEEHDPTAITASTAPADTIAPFSEGRLNLYNSGYFHDPNVPFPGGSSLSAGIKVLTGTTASDGNPTYTNNRPLYFVFRDSDVNLTEPAKAWQPGSTKNWAHTLFLSVTSWFRNPGASALIAAAGVVPTTGAAQDKGCLAG